MTSKTKPSARRPASKRPAVATANSPARAAAKRAPRKPRYENAAAGLMLEAARAAEAADTGDDNWPPPDFATYCDEYLEGRRGWRPDQ
jgi:hypothetical protein